MAMADEVRAQISDQELRDLEAELEQARQRIAELESLDYERIIQQPLRRDQVGIAANQDTNPR
jgi:hypothetical protein